MSIYSIPPQYLIDMYAHQVPLPASEGAMTEPRHVSTPPTSVPPHSTPMTPTSKADQHQAIRRLSEVPRPRSYSTGAAGGVTKPPAASFHNNWKLKRAFEQVQQIFSLYVQKDDISNVKHEMMFQGQNALLWK